MRAGRLLSAGLCLLRSLLLLLGLLGLAFLLVGFTRVLGLAGLFCLACLFALGLLGFSIGCGGTLLGSLGSCILFGLGLGGCLGFSLLACFFGLGGFGPGGRCFRFGLLAFGSQAGFLSLARLFRTLLGIGALGGQVGLFSLAGSLGGGGTLTGSFLGSLFAGQSLTGGRFAGLGFASRCSLGGSGLLGSDAIGFSLGGCRLGRGCLCGGRLGSSPGSRGLRGARSRSRGRCAASQRAAVCGRTVRDDVIRGGTCRTAGRRQRAGRDSGRRIAAITATAASRQQEQDGGTDLDSVVRSRHI